IEAATVLPSVLRLVPPLKRGVVEGAFFRLARPDAGLDAAQVDMRDRRRLRFGCRGFLVRLRRHDDGPFLCLGPAVIASLVISVSPDKADRTSREGNHPAAQPRRFLPGAEDGDALAGIRARFSGRNSQ